MKGTEVGDVLERSVAHLEPCVGADRTIGRCHPDPKCRFQVTNEMTADKRRSKAVTFTERPTSGDAVCGSKRSARGLRQLGDGKRITCTVTAEVEPDAT
jgi:hypothetical protein